MPKICLDPGHCTSGADTGAQGNGLREELLTLDICQRIKPLLKYNGFTIVMTRNGDLVDGLNSGYSLNQSLQRHCDIANQAQANLFISVHINSGGGTGQEVWIYGTGGQAEKFAEIAKYYLLQQCGWADRGVKAGNLYVLKYTAMPAILTENGFIDNTSDAAKLANPDFRQKIAVAQAKAVCDYFGQEYKEGGNDVKLKYLVLYYGDADLQIVADLALYYQCPIVQAAYATSELLAAAETKYQVGGFAAPASVTLLGGSDRFDTMKSVLKTMGKV